VTLFQIYTRSDIPIIKPLERELQSQDFALYDPFSRVAATPDLMNV